MKHYWAVKHEFQGIDSVGGACQIATVQLDVEDAERFRIVFTNPDGDKQGCVICHSSIGALERRAFLIIEAAVKMKILCFPMWITPLQVRIAPVSEQFVAAAVGIAKRLRSRKVRAEVEDRNKTVSNRIRLAEIDWIPYILVYGKKEKEGDVLSVKKWGSNKPIQMGVDDLADDIRDQCGDMPFRQSTLPMLMSRKPADRKSASSYLILRPVCPVSALLGHCGHG